MTEFEMINLINAASENIGESAMNIATIFFAYIACAFLVGDKLTPVLSAAVSVSYTFFILGPFYAIRIAIGDMVVIATTYLDTFPGGVIAQQYGAFSTETAYLFVAIGPAFASWLLSLAYMHFYVRSGSRNGIIVRDNEVMD